MPGFRFGPRPSYFASHADQLRKALVTYTASGGQGNPTFDTAQAIAVMLESTYPNGVVQTNAFDTRGRLLISHLPTASGVLLNVSGNLTPPPP